MMIAQEIKKKWKPRPQSSHKGDFGRIFILVGSRGLTGAAHLAGMGAARAGGGLVTVGVPDRVYPIVAKREAGVMVRPFPSTRQGTLALRAYADILKFSKTQDVFAIGPGLSQNSETQKLIRKLVSHVKLPVVIDADGLNAFKNHIGALKACRGRAVLTPHPGEFVRVFSGKLSADPDQRKKRAVEIARRYGVIMVLKGHRTVVAGPAGQVYVNKTGNPGMATGGTGDVLTGVIASLLGQNFGLYDAARFGVFIHGFAGDLAAKKIGRMGLVASDLPEFLPQAIRTILGHKGT